jgi:iron complex outermembrane receptor protein
VRTAFSIIVFISLAAAGLSGRAWAQTPVFTDFGLEELMNIQVEPVFGASKRVQPVTQAPASVTIVTREEIARYGYRTLADILRGVRGFQISNDRNYSYLSTRGFARPGDYNTRILLLVDGHRMNDNVYEAAQIGAEFGLDPFMFERVEIVRGPSASLYGTSAFFAVVNVIMRKGSNLNGPVVSVDAGSLGSRAARAAIGRTWARGDWALAGGYSGTDGSSRLYFPAFDAPDTNDGVVEGIDDEAMGHLFGRFRIGRLTFTGAYGRRAKSVPTASYFTRFNDPDLGTVDRRGFIDGEYSGALKGTQVLARGYLDRYHYTGRYPYDGAGPGLVDDLRDYAVGVWAGTEVRASRDLPGRQTVTVGGELRDNFTQSQGATVNGTLDGGFAIDGSSVASAVYGQHEIALHRVLRTNLGLRYDGYGDWSRVTPRAAVIVTPSARQAIKYLYGTAFRAPNAYELYYYSEGERASWLRPETITSHELVWEQYMGTWLRTSVSAYRNRVSQLLSLTPDPAKEEDLRWINQGGANAHGFEIEADWRFRRLEGRGSYTIQKAVEAGSETPLSNSPRHAGMLRLSLPAVGRGSTIAFETYMLARRGTLAGNFVSRVVTSNLTLVEPVGGRVDLVAHVHNLFNRAYADPGSEEHRQDVIPQDGRTFTVGLRWRYGSR